MTHLRPQGDLPSGGRNVRSDPKVTSLFHKPRQIASRRVLFQPETERIVVGSAEKNGKIFQKQTMRKLLEELHERYPCAVIVGHHDLNPHKAEIKRGQNQKFLDFAEQEQARPKVKDCPCIINVASEYKDLSYARACSCSTK